MNSLVTSLGEPKRVRTVSVRPDGTVVSPDQPSGAMPLPAAPPPPRAVATVPVAPSAAAGPTMTGATTPAATPQATPAPQPRAATPMLPPAATAAAPARPAAPAPSVAAPSSPPPAAPSAAQPQQQRTAAATAPAAATGGFSVQLGAQPTEEQARKVAQEMRQKLAGTLRGRSPQVKAADVNGSTLYRIRVGPMSQDDANDLCARLKAAKSACFVARN
jgi:cell division protein FtsN